MSSPKKVPVGLLLISLFLQFVLPVEASPEAAPRPHRSTRWQIVPSFKFDTLCLLNILTGDPFYLQYYQKDYEALSPELTPAARQALADLKRRVKDENKNIISAFLALYFSATNDESLDDMLRTLRDSGQMRARLEKTPYYSDGGWKLYESVRDDLRTIFLWLKKTQFDRRWEREIRPRVERKVRELQPELPKYDVVPEIERVLGSRLPADRITVYMLYYSQPHGIRITGARFLTDVAWPFRVVLRNAVHEMMHPPYDLQTDPELQGALQSLQGDPFLMDKVEHHNPAFGYNSLSGFLEEDCVQALDQVVSENLGVGRDPRRRWKQDDDGMHVFAVALYARMKEKKFAEGSERFRDFLLRMVRSGELGPGSIRASYDAFYAEPSPTPGD